jgi:hypothetical protein
MFINRRIRPPKLVHYAVHCRTIRDWRMRLIGGVQSFRKCEGFGMRQTIDNYIVTGCDLTTSDQLERGITIWCSIARLRWRAP